MHASDIMMIIFSVVCLLDIGFAAGAFRHGKAKGVSLGCACLGAFVTTAFYLISLYVEDPFLYAVLSSVYFFGIDFSLVSILTFTCHFTEESNTRGISALTCIASILMLADGIVLAVNPFRNIAVSFVPQETELINFVYEFHPLYYFHLVYTYLLVGIVLFFLIRKVICAPRIYANQYLYSVLSLMVVVGINAIYLFLPGLFGENNIDYSLIGYSLAAAFFYWYGLRYESHGLLSNFHTWIFENVNQAIVLFDYDDKLIMYNKKAEEVMPDGLLADKLRLVDFMRGCGLKRGHETNGLRYSFQCFINGFPMRCDYSAQVDKKQNRLGRLFVFSSVATQFDMLTGFRSWGDFKASIDTLFPDQEEMLIVATCDINSLTDINRMYGRENGDRAIQRLAEEMRAEFPTGTEFARSREASIAAVCRNSSVAEVEACFRRIQQKLIKNDFIDCPIQFQSSVSVRGQDGVLETIRRNLRSMKLKKLMDRTSVHSEMLRSLLQALEQCDSDTGAHVQRTQRSGEELGKRIGLSDQQQSQLALLAILHDIGKIGIPLEILNKPGKLTDAEWKMLQTHTEKGYQIARSSQELSEIADMILYHHERWDGRGYPTGLKENQIPLLSRIIAVVDAYDAMTNDRAYRKALSESAARSELKRCAGTQFDPNIVREFLLMLEENDQKLGITVSTMSQQEPETVSGFRQTQPGLELEERKNVHAMAYSMYVLDNESRIVQVDDRFETMTGYSGEDVRAGNLFQSSLIFEEDQNEYLSLLSSMMPQQTDVYLEHRLRRKDGTAIFVYCYGHAFYDSAVGQERTRIIIINSDDPFVK